MSAQPQPQPSSPPPPSLPPPPVLNPPVPNALSKSPSLSHANGAPSRPPSDDEKRYDAWHYYGYPAYANWMASSDDFFVLRRYSAVAARCLLVLQYRIGKKEKLLQELDSKSIAQPLGQAHIDSIEKDLNPERQKVLTELLPLLQQYYDLVNSFGDVKSKPTARQHHIESLHNWFDAYPYAINPKEQFWKDEEGDLFAVRFKPRLPFGQLLEKMHWVRRIFKSPQTSTQVNDSSTEYHSNTRLDFWSSVMIIFAGFFLLIGPMWWLNYVQTARYRLGIITGFVAIFVASLWLAAGQRPFEITAATAAYAAVLSVFLQGNTFLQSAPG